MAAGISVAAGTAKPAKAGAAAAAVVAPKLVAPKLLAPKLPVLGAPKLPVVVVGAEKRLLLDAVGSCWPKDVPGRDENEEAENDMVSNLSGGRGGKKPSNFSGCVF